MLECGYNLKNKKIFYKKLKNLKYKKKYLPITVQSNPGSMRKSLELGNISIYLQRPKKIH